MLIESKLVAGIPSFQETGLWDHGGTFSSLVLPFDGQACLQFIERIGHIFEKHNHHYHPGALHNHNPHSLVQLVGARLSKTDKEANKLVVELMRDVISEGGKFGYGEYRTPIIFMDDATKACDFNNNALLRLNETIKDALDPNGIMAPGKMECGEHLRGGNHEKITHT